MPTREELLARMAELQALITSMKSVHRNTTRTKAQSPDKARKAKFKREAWVRAHLHTALNRYHRS